MISNFFFPNENEGSRSASYLMAAFICYYWATSLSVLLAVIGHCTSKIFLILISIGFLVDCVRRFVAPELKLSAEGRFNYISKAIHETVCLNHYSKLARNVRRVISTFYAIYIIGFLFFLSVGNTSFYPEYTILRLFFCLPSKIYPFLQYHNVMLASFGSQERSDIVMQFISISWWFMIIVLISEMFGVAFYSIPASIIERRKYSSQKKAIEKKSRSFFIFLFFSVVGYTLTGIMEITKSEIITSGSNLVELRPFPDFIYGVVICGIALVFAAYSMSGIYMMALSKISNGIMFQINNKNS